MSTAEPTDNIAALTYEQARDQLRDIVQTLETGSAPLEETLKLWQRGEELSRHCQHILTAAQQRIDQALQGNPDSSSHPVE